MQKPSALAFVALLVLAGLAAVPSAQAATPSVVSVSPSNGNTNGGIEVTITGTGTYSDSVSVTIDGRPARVSELPSVGAATDFKVIVPARPKDATPAAPTAVNLVVRNGDGTSTTATGAFTYTVSNEPTLSSVTPTSAPSTGGAVLTINGANFATGEFLPTVTIGGTPARVFLVDQPSVGGTAPTASRLRVEAPAHAPGEVDIVLTNPDGKSKTLEDSLTFSNAAAPVIGALTVTSGASNGATFVAPAFRITGDNFANGLAVTFGGARATVEVVDSETINVLKLPAHAAGTVDVVVQNPDGRTATRSAGFIYTASAAPGWHATDPGAGQSLPISLPSVGGALVCLRSSNVVEGATITVGGLSASRVGVGSPSPIGTRDDDCPVASNLSFYTPQRPATATPATGPVNVVVTNPDGRSATLTNAINVIETVAALGVSPKSGTCTGGQAVTISGIGFVAGARVFFDHDSNNAGAPKADLNGDGVYETLNEEATGVSGSGNSLTAIAPPVACGGTAVTGDPVGILVLNGDGRLTVLRRAFDYTTAPDPAFASTSWISPTSSNTLGGGSVTIVGSNFATGPVKPAVYFDFDDDSAPDANERAIVGSVGANSITAIVPTRPTDTASPVDVNLIVVNPGGGDDVQVDGFTYTAAPNPVISHYSTPPSTTTNGGSTLTIGATSGGGDFVTGSRYDQISATNPNGAILPTVTIGGVQATVTAVSTKQLTIVLPAFSTTSSGRTIAVTNPNGDAADNDSGIGDLGPESVVYSNAPAPAITSVSGGTGSTGGRTVVTINGNNFAAGANKPLVCFGGAGDADNDGDCDTANTEGEVTANSASAITVVAPATATQGIVDLIVENPDRKSDTQANGFNYNALSAPSISSLSVAQAPRADLDVALRITGSGFAAPNGVSVTINDATALSDLKVVSPTEITGTIPAGAAAGVATVKVAHIDGQSVTSNAFRYLAAPPVVDSIGTTTGPTHGGTALSFAGSGFTAQTAAFVGGFPAPFVDFVGVSSLLADTPARPASTVTDTLVVEAALTDATGQTGSMAAVFTVVKEPQPTVRSAFPASGPALGGREVTIKGTGFFKDAEARVLPRVVFGGIDGTDVTVVDSGTITVTSPSHAAGITDLVVINPDLQEAKLTGAVTFLGTGGAAPTSSSSTSATTTTGSGGSTTSQTTTAPPTTGPTTTGPTSTGPTTTGPLTPPTEDVIEAANKKVRITVTREGDDNKVSWVLPAATELPSLPVLGIQLWASNSPYALVDTFPANSQAFTDRSYTHTAGDSPAAQADTGYLVTMYYGVSPEFGFYTASTAPDTDDYEPITQAGSAGSGGDGGNDLPAWAIVLILLGILFLVVLVAILIARGRNRDGGAQTAQQGYAWEQSEAKAADAEWEGGAGGEVHQARCPACATSFTATGSKPIVTVCPGCGKKGILR